jgi:hypothetical protein
LRRIVLGSRVTETTMLADDDAFSGSDSSWFVYLLPLADCSAFKVGFSCNPLQRIYSFSHRYFERFDLYQSVLLEVTDCADARAIEGTLKTELVQFRAKAPSWVPAASGGHTEWFQAVQFPHAEGRLRSFTNTMDAARLASTSEYIHAELIKVQPSFEVWAWNQAQLVSDARSRIRDSAEFIETVSSLRDWLHAYRYFDVPVFTDDAAVREYVAGIACDR